MHLLLFFGPSCVLVLAGCVISAWPGVVGIKVEPNYLIVSFEAVGLFFLLSMWLGLAWNGREFDKAVDRTANINNHPHYDSFVRDGVVEPDPRYEQNSGIKRWIDKHLEPFMATARIYLFLVFTMTLMTGCAAADVQAQPLASTPETVASTTALMATPAPSPVPTMKVVGTPTVDYVEQIRQSELKLQQSEASATIAGLTQQVIDTAQAKLDRAREKTETRVTSKTQTLEAQAQQTADRGATETVQAPLNERERIRTAWEPAIQMSFCISWTFFFSALVWAVLVLGRAKYLAIMTKAGYPVAESKQSDSKPLNVKLDMRDDYGWGSTDFSTLPIDRPTLRKVAQLIVTGWHYTERQMTGSEKPLTKDGTFDSFGQWMVLNRIAIQLPDGRYVIQHKEFFEQVLKEEQQ